MERSLYPHTHADDEATKAADDAALNGVWQRFTGESRDGVIGWYEFERQNIEAITGKPATNEDVIAAEAKAMADAAISYTSK